MSELAEKIVDTFEPAKAAWREYYDKRIEAMVRADAMGGTDMQRAVEAEYPHRDVRDFHVAFIDEVLRREGVDLGVLAPAPVKDWPKEAWDLFTKMGDENGR